MMFSPTDPNRLSCITTLEEGDSRVWSKLLIPVNEGWNCRAGLVGITEDLTSRLVVQDHAEEATMERQRAAAVIEKAELPVLPPSVPPLPEGPPSRTNASSCLHSRPRGQNCARAESRAKLRYHANSTRERWVAYSV